MTPTVEFRDRSDIYPKTGPDSHTYAKIIADSISPEGHRLTTFEVRFHRFVLAEFNTHRVFSRNSASSRARPTGKNLDDVFHNLAMPLDFPKEKRGMQGGEPLDEDEWDDAEMIWRRAAHEMSVAVEDLMDLGVHKSVANRLLEPFMWHTVIVTATEWDNFFKQRVSPLAQPEISLAAGLMKTKYENSDPTPMKPGEWHLPYIAEGDRNVVLGRYAGMTVSASDLAFATEDLKKVSVARCARVSYLTHDGKRDIWKDLDLYDRLVSADPMHASPLEHVATPDPWNVEELEVPLSGGRRSRTLTVPKIGNFLGWRQHRLEVELERGIHSYE